MKARKNRNRWVLIALLFGFLASAGLILTRHHTIVMVTGTASPNHAVPQQLNRAPVGSVGGLDTFVATAGAPSDPDVTSHWYSNSQQPHVSGHSDSPSTASTASTDIGAGSGSHAAAPAGVSSEGTQAQSSSPATATTASSLPQNGAGDFAYNGFVPLDCELPAGCGAPGGIASHGSRQPTVTSGAMPFVHNSQGSTPPNDGSDPPTNSDLSNPGSNPPPAAAPELDPATLAGAVTLLLGSLAVLRSRRVRVTR